MPHTLSTQAETLRPGRTWMQAPEEVKESSFAAVPCYGMLCCVIRHAHHTHKDEAASCAPHRVQVKQRLPIEPPLNECEQLVRDISNSHPQGRPDRKKVHPPAVKISNPLVAESPGQHSRARALWAFSIYPLPDTLTGTLSGHSGNTWCAQALSVTMTKSWGVLLAVSM
jgi:hypothetical protein